VQIALMSAPERSSFVITNCSRFAISGENAGETPFGGKLSANRLIVRPREVVLRHHELLTGR